MEKKKCSEMHNWECPDNFLHLKQIDGQWVTVECWKKRYLDNYWIREFSKELLDLSPKDIDKTTNEKELKLLKYLFDSAHRGAPIGCYIYGKTGIGKTHRAICYCNYLNKERNKTIAYIYVSDMINKMKQNFDGNSKKNDLMIQKCINADILVLDDLGQETTNKWWYSNILLVILNARAESGKPVIVVSNLSPKQLRETMIKNMNIDKSEEIMVDRIISRLSQCCNNKVFTWDGKDRRLGWNM